MAVLTHQQEKFAQAIVAGKSQADAYREAYPASKHWKIESVYSKASVLMGNGMIVSRLEELRKPVMQALRYDLKTAMEEAMEAFEVSKANRQGGAMVAAAQLRAKLNGLLVERKEISVTQMGDMTPTEKEMLLLAAQEELKKKKQLLAMQPDQGVEDVTPKA